MILFKRSTLSSILPPATNFIQLYSIGIAHLELKGFTVTEAQDIPGLKNHYLRKESKFEQNIDFINI